MTYDNLIKYKVLLKAMTVCELLQSICVQSGLPVMFQISMSCLQMVLFMFEGQQCKIIQ